MVFPHRQALRAWLLPFRYIDGTCLSSYSPQRAVAFKVAEDGRSESGLHATLGDFLARIHPAPSQADVGPRRDAVR